MVSTGGTAVATRYLFLLLLPQTHEDVLEDLSDPVYLLQDIVVDTYVVGKHFVSSTHCDCRCTVARPSHTLRGGGKYWCGLREEVEERVEALHCVIAECSLIGTQYYPVA